LFDSLLLRIVGNGLIVEIKTVTALVGIHQAQVISYLKTCEQSLGLLLNFRETAMRKGIKRVVWTPKSVVDRATLSPRSVHLKCYPQLPRQARCEKHPTTIHDVPSDEIDCKFSSKA